MLEHLSPKFRAQPTEREPRAALILNRFTRTLNVMFATNAVSSILGVPADQIQGKSFYECIQENCLQDAVRCLESAKANDSIAYLRFWYRDPRREEDFDDEGAIDGIDGDMDDERRNVGRASTHSSDSDGGGAQLYGQMDVDGHSPAPQIKVEDEEAHQNLEHISSGSHLANPAAQSGSSSGEAHTPASALSLRQSPNPGPRRGRRQPIPSIELEAVVSCTSDGLVVVLRKARPAIPLDHPPQVPQVPQTYENGLFAAPWGQHSIQPQASLVQPEAHQRDFALHMPVHNGTVLPAAADGRPGGPPLDQLMRSIRDVAVFAWALVGINGTLASHSRGTARDEAQPDGGLPVWDPRADSNVAYRGPENQAVKRWTAYDKGKRAAPSFFTGPFQFDPYASTQQQPLDSGYSTQGSGMFEAQGYGAPPSVRDAWVRYHQQQQQHHSAPLNLEQQSAAPAFQDGFSSSHGQSMNGFQTHRPQAQGFTDSFDHQSRYETGRRDQAPQPGSVGDTNDGQSQFDAQFSQAGQPGNSSMDRYPWN